MNAITQIRPATVAPMSRAAYRAYLAQRRAVTGQPAYTTTRDLEMDMGSTGSASVRVEIEFYQSSPAIAATRWEPGEPAQYEVASIRAFTNPLLSTGLASTERDYLNFPTWLEDMLIAGIDADTLEPYGD